jgi:beta-mannosidase
MSTRQFYDLCEEKGLLIWQDLHVSCAMYPSNPEFLASVEAELRYQVPRLKDHPLTRTLVREQ